MTHQRSASSSICEVVPGLDESPCAQRGYGDRPRLCPEHRGEYGQLTAAYKATSKEVEGLYNDVKSHDWEDTTLWNKASIDAALDTAQKCIDTIDREILERREHHSRFFVELHDGHEAWIERLHKKRKEVNKLAVQMRRCKVKLIEKARWEARTGHAYARPTPATACRLPPLDGAGYTETQPSIALCRARIQGYYGALPCNSYRLTPKSGLCATHLQEYRDLSARHQQALDQCGRLQQIISRTQTMVAFGTSYDKASDVAQAILEVRQYIAAFDETGRLADKLGFYAETSARMLEVPGIRRNTAIGLLSQLTSIQYDLLVKSSVRTHDNLRPCRSQPGSDRLEEPQANDDSKGWGVMIGLVAAGTAAMLGCGVVGSLAIGGVVLGGMVANIGA
ncbi:hypothetical protein C8Q78DRAFT_1073049 [Trametes maxima]|nr:hypothetical protein C8Q78DRAFT_1073049 [Trametes maxima]